MPWFKRKPKAAKVVHHDLTWVGFAPAQMHFYKAVECRNCGKQFIMDVLGGWSIEWKWEFNEKHRSLNTEDLTPAVDAYHKAGVRGWTQLGYTDVCEGPYPILKERESPTAPVFD